MVSLKRSEMRIFDDAFDMHQGYVLDFSDRTMAEFFEDEIGIEIYHEKYQFNGSSRIALTPPYQAMQSDVCLAVHSGHFAV